MSDPHPPRVLHNRFALDAVGASPIRQSEACFGRPSKPARFHGERQDTSLPGWRRLAELTDVLPLLVNACSTACVQLLPAPAEGYNMAPHQGGPEVEQPKPW